MSAIYRFGLFTLDAERLTLFAGHDAVRLAPKVVQTLAILVERAGALVTKDELMDRLWPEGFVEEGNLTQNVYVLRRTLHAHGVAPAIENIPRRGYRFVAPVELLSAQPAKPALRIISRRAIAAAACVALALLGSAFVPRTRVAAALPADGMRVYAMGRYYWSLRTRSGLARAVRDFTEIATRYPRSALGYAGLADTYTEMYDYVCDGAPCAATVLKAQSYARMAMAADPASPEAHTSAAMTARLFERNLEKSDCEFQRAIALDPKYALAHEWYGNSLLARGDLGRARKELQQAVALQPVSVATYAWLARDAYYEHHYADAIANAREALAINPNRIETTVLLGLALEENGNEGAAVSVFRALSRMGSSRDAQALIAGAYAHRGQRALALEILQEARGGASGDNFFARDLALGFLQLGDHERALHLLRRARFANDMERTFFTMDPRLDAVRSDARFRTWTLLAAR